MQEIKIASRVNTRKIIWLSLTFMQYNVKRPSTKDVRQVGRGVVLKFRTFPDGGREGGLRKFGRPKTSEKIEIPKFLRAL